MTEPKFTRASDAEYKLYGKTGLRYVLLGSEKDDSAVYRLTDSMSHIDKVADSFIQFFESEVERLLISWRFDNRRDSCLTMDDVMRLTAQREGKG